MKFRIITEKGSWNFEADEIFQSENAIIGRKNDKDVVIVSKENVIGIIPAE